MSQIIQAIRGMPDILPEQIPYWHFLEQQVKTVISNYGYQEIRLPIVEKTHLFSRSIGEVTDIVEKEMYTFADRNGELLSLRPEGTAGCVRAVIENGLLHNQTHRLWYTGPMFRHERPQKGRYRQFYHIGVEAFGMSGPDIDIELIQLTAQAWKQLGISEHLTLEINSLGTTDTRKVYRDQLVTYFNQHLEQLDEDSKRRLKTSPLRILDSKNPAMKAVIDGAPSLLASLDKQSSEHFHYLCEALDKLQIAYKVNPRLVRGLDYYCHTVFEWVTDSLGAQGTVCAGGRYDGLVEMVGGKSTPAIGFAIGLDRIVLLLQQVHPLEKVEKCPDIYLIMVGDKAFDKGLQLQYFLRNKFPNLFLITHCGGGSLKSQFKKADKSKAKLALIIGDDEVREEKVTVKFLREKKEQFLLSREELFNLLDTEDKHNG